jgi:hypothetical protein
MVSLDTPPTGEVRVIGWQRSVGSYAHCDAKGCTTRRAGSMVLYRTLHNPETAHAYATQLCVPCKLREVAEQFALDGELPSVDVPVVPEGEEPPEVPDPDWLDPSRRKAVRGVLVDRDQFVQMTGMCQRMIAAATEPDSADAEPTIELTSEAKRKGREKKKRNPQLPDEVSGDRGKLGA